MPSPENPRLRAALESRRRTVMQGAKRCATSSTAKSPSPVRRRRPVLDPRPGRRPRLRAPPQKCWPTGQRHPAGHARLFEKAAHHHRLEGLHQRPGHGRLLPGRCRHGTCARSSCSTSPNSACRPAPKALDPISPQYLGDLISWTAIGARTTESQTHREMSSGLSTPVGFKNGTNGDVGIAINAILSPRGRTVSSASTARGKRRSCAPSGNRYGHLVLRGGDGRPNYDTVSVRSPNRRPVKAGCRPTSSSIARMPTVTRTPNCSRWSWPTSSTRSVRQPLAGRRDDRIEPRRRQPADPRKTSRNPYGCSVTDACVDWETTERCCAKPPTTCATCCRIESVMR